MLETPEVYARAQGNTIDNIGFGGLVWGCSHAGGKAGERSEIDEGQAKTLIRPED